MCLCVRRVELLIQCDAGTYQLQSGQGGFGIQDPGCGSSHCDVINQPIMATVEVVSLLCPTVCTCVCLYPGRGLLGKWGATIVRLAATVTTAPDAAICRMMPSVLQIQPVRLSLGKHLSVCLPACLTAVCPWQHLSSTSSIEPGTSMQLQA